MFGRAEVSDRMAEYICVYPQGDSYDSGKGEKRRMGWWMYCCVQTSRARLSQLAGVGLRVRALYTGRATIDTTPLTQRNLPTEDRGGPSVI